MRWSARLDMDDTRYKIMLLNKGGATADRRLRDLLREAGSAFELVRTAGYDKGRELIDGDLIDILLLDLDHANGQVEELLARIRDHSGRAPVIVLARNDRQGLGAKAILAGACDYLSKERMNAESLQRALRQAAERGKMAKAFQESEARYRRLLASVTDYVYTVQVADGRPSGSVHGPGCVAVTGYSSEEYAADPYLWYRMIHEEDRQPVVEMTNQVFSGKTPQPLEHRIIHKSGGVRWIKNTMVPHTDQRGLLVAYDGLVSDITDRITAEQKLRHVAYHDSLTDLPNRELFIDRLSRALIQARRHERLLGVMFLDLDRFKYINDTLGHKTGDLLLRSVAERLVNCTREDDTVARLGGDEFIVLFSDMAQGQDALLVAKKIQDALLKSFLLEGREFFITASIGISLYPSDGTDVDTLIKNADVAMYQAKAQGRNNYQFYRPSMNAQALRKLILESDLRKALLNEEFILHYQPIVELSTGRITGAEALVRWQHPVLGLLPPLEFISLSEDTGLIIPLGEWILEKACLQAKAWHDAGASPFRVTVNLSMRQFSHSAVTEAVSRALNLSQLDPQFLELELTESMVMQNAEHTVAMLHDLKAMGIQLSLDDFGTGYSSLSYLKYLPLNKLKLDQSFVSALAGDRTNEAISKTIIALAHSLNLQVIAEGVETPEQLELLRRMKCDEVQGFLFSRPVPAADMTRLLLNDGLANRSGIAPAHRARGQEQRPDYNDTLPGGITEIDQRSSGPVTL